MIVSTTESGRQLQNLSYQEGSILSRNLPTDTILKSLVLRLSGSVVTTFASGTPVADSLSTFDNLINRIDVIVSGGRTVKSVRPHLMRMQQLFTSQILAERKASAGAAALAGNNPTADSGFVYGTTGQITTAAESILISFEMVYCDPGHGLEETWLNTKGLSSAELRLTTASFSKLLGFGNTAPVVFSASTFIIDIFTREAQGIPAGQKFRDWKQTTKELTFAAETTDYQIDINRGNLLTGIMLFVRDGAAGTTTTATGKLPTNLGLKKINLKINGSVDNLLTTFQAQQAKNKLQYGVNSPFASNASLMDGVCHLNFLTAKDLRSALDVVKADNVSLFVTTAPAAEVSYVGTPVSVTVMTEEVTQQY